jgi:hypothetical protein
VRANIAPLRGKGNNPGLPDQSSTFPIVVAEFERNAREIVRVALDTYNGRYTINVRVWYRDGDQVKPGKTGITLGLKHLPKLASGLGNALSRAKALGLISTD